MENSRRRDPARARRGQDRRACTGGPLTGANNVIDMARVLEARNVPVALLITLAPYKQDPIPDNVRRAINYYQSTVGGLRSRREPVSEASYLISM